MKRIITTATAILLVAVMLVSALVLPSMADETAAPAGFTGQSNRQTEEITLADGTKTGVQLTKLNLSGDYGNNKEVNIAEFDLANTHLSVEVVNSGTYAVSSKTTAGAVADYNAAHKGQTVLAAINGDLWMTGVHSNDKVTTKTLKTSRGVIIIDGEIWASQQIDAENAEATNNEKGTAAGDKSAFGVTKQNQPLVGSPDIKVSISVGDTTVKADGLNRLPAINSLIVYNHRIYSSNCALNDAYEVELEVADSAAFTAGGTLTATVKAIYPAGSTERPAIGEKTVLLTARGNKINAIKDKFNVGDTVAFSTTLADRMGRTELWQDVDDAIGGHMPVLIDGKPGAKNSSTSEYPTALIGYKDDGTVALITVTSAKDKTYAGLRFNKALQFCREAGYNSVFYLDGGGSTTFVALEEGSYTVRNKCSDGSPRAVINSVAVVWNDTPVCEHQGSLSYIKLPVDYSGLPATYLDGAFLAELVGSPNAVTLRYDEAEKALAMTTTQQTVDPYATLDYSILSRVEASQYPYLVFKVKTDHPQSTNFMLYYATGSNVGASPARTKSFYVRSGMDDWKYLVVDMSRISGWTGLINDIRLDIFDGANTAEGVTMYIGAIVLCQTKEEAQSVSSGWTPEGCIPDYLAYLESLKPVETEPPTEAPTEPVTEPVTEPETEFETETETEPERVTEPETETESVAYDTAIVTSEPETLPSGGGCGSAVSTGAAALLLSAMAAAAVMKRKD